MSEQDMVHLQVFHYKTRTPKLAGYCLRLSCDLTESTTLLNKINKIKLKEALTSLFKLAVCF